ncbi:hypothetical protein [Companilactobacillus mishanensis]|uniref:Uncharacterized protein n=1 Tax=Companilactobacillus mishanensis TaxID=2486008 RepID=A0A5P0ZEG8_9LACO|nr:hypothetical protein [Companilactobacillus mishanensis]MQS51447.1 hypothetical protein [Companilactobacillus mishanensis]
MNDKGKLPEWNKKQIEEQKKINKKLTFRAGLALIITIAVIIVAIIVGFASCDRNSTPQKPANNASVSAIEKYEKIKFSDNNASSINKIYKSKKTGKLIVKVDNVDASYDTSASNSFGQLTDELQSVGSYDAAKKGVIFYGDGAYTDETGKEVDELSFAIFFTQADVNSLNSNYSDYVGSGNYDSLFKSSDAYYLYEPFAQPNKLLNKMSLNKDKATITDSLKINIK